MPVRQSYQYSAPSGNGGGLVMGDPVDTKFFNVGNTVLKWGLDSDITGRLRLGGSVAGPGAQSLPVVPYGGFGVVGRNVSGSVTVTVDDCVLRCDSSGGNVTLNLPAAATMVDQFLDIYKTDAANSVTIDPNAAELINGESTYTFSGNRSPVRIRSNGTAWEVFLNEARLNNLVTQLSPAFTTTSGAYVTMASSASTFFSGRPVLFMVNFSARDVNGSDEGFGMAVGIQFDAGATTDFCDWSTDKANDHRATGAAGILTPAAGFRTVNLRVRRLYGAGTFTVDINDFIRFTSIEL